MIKHGLSTPDPPPQQNACISLSLMLVVVVLLLPLSLRLLLLVVEDALGVSRALYQKRGEEKQLVGRAAIWSVHASSSAMVVTC